MLQGRKSPPGKPLYLDELEKQTLGCSFAMNHFSHHVRKMNEASVNLIPFVPVVKPISTIGEAQGQQSKRWKAGTIQQIHFQSSLCHLLLFFSTDLKNKQTLRSLGNASVKCCCWGLAKHGGNCRECNSFPLSHQVPCHFKWEDRKHITTA